MTTPSTDVTHAIQQLRSGEKDSAIVSLRRVVEREPNNIQALLWLSGLTPDLQEGIAALDRVLQLDPDNEVARKGLADLTARQEAQQPSTSPEGVVTGEEILTLADTINWPFRGLNRPLGELVAEGTVTSRDLGWAARNSYDPAVKWAAAVQLKVNEVESVSLSLGEAQAVTWPFKNLDRPIGMLLAENVISLHDLAYAVANAREPELRNAAAVVGAEIVRGNGSLPEIAEVEAAPASEPVPAAKLRGRLRVIASSTYLVEQAERKARQRTTLGWALVATAFVAMIAGLMPLILVVLGVDRLPIGWAAVSLGLLVVVWRFVPNLGELLTEQRNFVVGRKGEERVVRLLYRLLDDEWALFRNVDLPDNCGDIDGVLVGPRGIFALEVKAYSGYNRNTGFKWQRKYAGFWRTLPRNPSKQARRNAARLGEYLKRCSVNVWVEPRVVWAGKGKLWLQRPAVLIWQVRDPAYLLEDMQKGKPVEGETVRKTCAVLHALRK